MRIPKWEIFQIPFQKKDEKVNTMLADIQFRPLKRQVEEYKAETFENWQRVVATQWRPLKVAKFHNGWMDILLET